MRRAQMGDLIRAGRKRVARQVKSGAYFQWDARRPRWRFDRFPPNCACATGMALLAVGYRGPWDNVAAHSAAVGWFGAELVEEVVWMNDFAGMRWDRIAAALGGVQSEKGRQR